MPGLTWKTASVLLPQLPEHAGLSRQLGGTEGSECRPAPPSAFPESSSEGKIRETHNAGKATAKHPSHTSRAEPPAQESTWRTKVSQTFPQPTAAPGEKRRERRGKKPQTNPNQLRKWRRKDAKELKALSRIPRGGGGSGAHPGGSSPATDAAGRAARGAPAAPPPPPPRDPRAGRLLPPGALGGIFTPTEARAVPRLLGRVAPPAPLTWRRSQPAAPGRTEPRRGEPTAPERSRPRRAEALRIAAHRAAPSPARPQLPEPRGAGAEPVPERSRGSRLAGGAALGKVPLGPAPSRQEIPPRPGLIGKARRVVRRGRAGAAVTHRDAASRGAGAGPPIPPHRHRSAPGWGCPRLPGIGSL